MAVPRKNPNLPFEPPRLDTKWKREKLEKKITEAIYDGLPVRDAFELAGIPKDTYYTWRQRYVEDIGYGYTGTNFLVFMRNVMKADKESFRRLSRKMMEKVDDGDTKMMIYMADNRFGYANRRKNQVELGSSSENNNIQINIIDMKSNDQIEETEHEEIVVNGVSRDDSDPAEVD